MPQSVGHYGTIRSRHWAHTIVKQAGIDYSPVWHSELKGFPTSSEGLCAWSNFRALSRELGRESGRKTLQAQRNHVGGAGFHDLDLEGLLDPVQQASVRPDPQAQVVYSYAAVGGSPRFGGRKARWRHGMIGSIDER